MSKEREMLEHAKIKAINLNIESLRELSDWCNEMADSLEREEEERVARER